MEFDHNHIALTSAPDIMEILAPLAKYGINYFDYFRLYKGNDKGSPLLGTDGARIWLSSHADVTKLVFQNAPISNITEFDKAICKVENRYCFWKDFPNFVVKGYGDKILRSIAASKEHFGIDHGFSIFNDSDNFVEAFNFASTNQHHNLYHFYLNHRDILELFIHYFHDKAKTILAKSEQNKIILPREMPVPPTSYEEKAEDRSYHALKNTLQPGRYYLPKLGEHHYLTPQEFNVVLLFSQNYKIKEIAKNLNLSPRTVESLLKNARIRNHLDRNTDLSKIFFLHQLHLTKK